MGIARSVPGSVYPQSHRNEEHHMTHLMDFLISALVILVGLFAFSWLANNPSSPLQGKV